MTADQMRAEQMIQQAHAVAVAEYSKSEALRLVRENRLLRDIIRHLCDPENVPYPMTSPEL